MHTRLKVFNSSNDQTIYICLSSLEDMNTSEPDKIQILPNSTKSIDIKYGVMNISVWVNGSKETIWTGIVPVKVEKTVIISPEQSKVYYDDIEIPGIGKPIKKSSSSIWFWICVFLAIILIFLLYFNRR